MAECKQKSKNILRTGGFTSSTINMVAITMGAGNISLSYVLMKNGYLFGSILILIGGILSYYTGMLIVRCSHFTGKLRYEEISAAIYGPKMGKLTSILMLACQIGAAFSYIVFIKTSVPYVIEQYTDNIYVTTWFGNNKMG